MSAVSVPGAKTEDRQLFFLECGIWLLCNIDEDEDDDDHDDDDDDEDDDDVSCHPTCEPWIMKWWTFDSIKSPFQVPFH